jgi:hypothetical protein
MTRQEGLPRLLDRDESWVRTTIDESIAIFSSFGSFPVAFPAPRVFMHLV